MERKLLILLTSVASHKAHALVHRLQRRHVERRLFGRMTVGNSDRTGTTGQTAIGHAISPRLAGKMTGAAADIETSRGKSFHRTARHTRMLTAPFTRRRDRFLSGNFERISKQKRSPHHMPETELRVDQKPQRRDMRRIRALQPTLKRQKRTLEGEHHTRAKTGSHRFKTTLRPAIERIGLIPSIFAKPSPHPISSAANEQHSLRSHSVKDIRNSIPWGRPKAPSHRKPELGNSFAKRGYGIAAGTRCGVEAVGQRRARIHVRFSHNTPSASSAITNRGSIGTNRSRVHARTLHHTIDDNCHLFKWTKSRFHDHYHENKQDSLPASTRGDFDELRSYPALRRNSLRALS